jgi:hypothetical protein
MKRGPGIKPLAAAGGRERFIINPAIHGAKEPPGKG